jgi:hypothetical protein
MRTTAKRPIAASALLGVIAFLFAVPLGVGLAILVLGAGSAPIGAFVAACLVVFLFAIFAASAIYALHVSPVWPIFGVAAGFAGFIAWLAYTFSGMD